MAVGGVLGFLFVFMASVASTQARPREELVESLMRTSKLYSAVIPPGTTDDDSPVEVDLDFMLIFVTVLSDDKVEVDGSLTMAWKDPRLAWSRERYNTSSIHLSQDSVWTPDITPYNSIDIRQRSVEKFAAVVTYDGTVTVTDRVTYRLPCINRSGRRFCTVRLGSWTHDALSVKVNSQTDHLSTDHLEPLTLIKVTNTSVTLDQVYRTQAYSTVTFHFTLEPHVGWFD